MKRKVAVKLSFNAADKRLLDWVARAQGVTRPEALRRALLEEAAQIERDKEPTVHEQLKKYIPKITK